MHSHLFDWKSMGSKLCHPSFCNGIDLLRINTFLLQGRNYESRNTPFFLLEYMGDQSQRKGKKPKQVKRDNDSTQGKVLNFSTYNLQKLKEKDITALDFISSLHLFHL